MEFSTSTQTHPWGQSYLDEQRKLIREFLTLQEQGVMPSYVTIQHIKGWIITNARKTFLNRFQETDKKRLHFAELVWKARVFKGLREMEEGVLTERQRCKFIQSSDQTTEVARPLVPQMAASSFDIPASPAMMRGEAATLIKKLPEVAQNSAEARKEVARPLVPQMNASSFDILAFPAMMRGEAATLIENLPEVAQKSAEASQAAQELMALLLRAVDLERRDRCQTQVILLRAVSDVGFQVRRAATQTKVMPRQIVLYSPTIRHILSQLMLQVNSLAFRHKRCLKAVTLSVETQTLLWTFPWVQVTEEKQLANTLLQAIDADKMVHNLIDGLVEVLGSRPLISKALAVGSQILTRYIVHLLTLNLAQLVPDSLSTNEEEKIITERSARAHFLPSKYIVSTELVEEFVIKFLLALHPPFPTIDHPQFWEKRLIPQVVLAMCIKMSALSLAMLRRIPEVTVDEKLPAPICKMGPTVLQLKDAMVAKFGTWLRAKNLVANKDPSALATIPQCVVEGVLTICQSLSQDDPAGASKLLTKQQRSLQRSSSEPDLAELSKASTEPTKKYALERNKFSDGFPKPVTLPTKSMQLKLLEQRLPQEMKQTLVEQYGSGIRQLKTFRRAFSDTPYSTHCVGKEEEEEEEERRMPAGTVLEHHLALDSSLANFKRQFPKSRILEQEEDLDDFCQVDFGGKFSVEVKARIQDKNRRSSEKPVFKVKLENPLIHASTVNKILIHLLKKDGQWASLSKRRALRKLYKEMVEHTQFLFQMEANQYKLTELYVVLLEAREIFTDPENEDLFVENVVQLVRDVCTKFFPSVDLRLTKLMKEPKMALILSSIIAKGLMIPAKEVCKEVYVGALPFSEFIRKKSRYSKLLRPTERPLTGLELRLERGRKNKKGPTGRAVMEDQQFWNLYVFDYYNDNFLPEERHDDTEEFRYPQIKDGMEKKKSFLGRFCRACLCGLFSCK